MNPLTFIRTDQEGEPVQRMAEEGEQPDPDRDVVMWVIYNRLTSDAFGLYVLRRQWVHAGEIVIDRARVLHRDIEPLRARLPPGLVCMPRQPDELITIAEVWI